MKIDQGVFEKSAEQKRLEKKIIIIIRKKKLNQKKKGLPLEIQITEFRGKS